jgi:hypothetical protein
MSKKNNPNLVKIHRNYSVEDVSNLLGVHKSTVRGWLKKGLQVIDNNKPALVLGGVLKRFLKKRREANKRTCKDDEIYCMRCRLPKKPAESMADFKLINQNVGCLSALCPECQSVMNKFVSRKKIRLIMDKLDVTLPQDQKQLFDTSYPFVNSDFK